MIKENTCFPVSENWSIEQLLTMNREDVISLWRTLPAVSLEELQGHFMGIVPNANDSGRQEQMKNYLYDEHSSRGYWLGKGFIKTGDNQGEGYNRCRLPKGEIKHSARFITEVAPSLIDGNPSFMMYYGAYHDHLPTFMDEIRKLEDYVYIGVGSSLDDEGKRELSHFLLLGPTDKWVGCDDGKLVEGFVKPSK